MDKIKWWQGATAHQRGGDGAPPWTTNRLFELDRDQGGEIARLQATLEVLMELLILNNLVEEEMLRALNKRS